MDYRSIVDLLEVMTGIMDLIGLQQIPHFTTLQKILQRIRSVYVIHISYTRGEVISVTGIDSFGFFSYTSSNYSRRTGKPRRSYIKTSIAVDMNNQVISGVRILKNNRRDIVHARTVVRQCHPARRTLHLYSGQGIRCRASLPADPGGVRSVFLYFGP